MRKNKALYAWFNGFMPFYRASSVPEDALFPYGTYEYTDGAFDAGEAALTVNLWFRTESEETSRTRRRRSFPDASAAAARASPATRAISGSSAARRGARA